MSGSPANGLKSNMIGSVALADADTLDVCVGTSHCGGNCTASGSARLVAGASAARSMLSVVFRRGSTKKSSGAWPWLVTRTGTVTAVPAASLVPALSGSPAAFTLTWLNRTLPVNGWEISSPTVGSANTTIRVQVPGTGLSV